MMEIRIAKENDLKSIVEIYNQAVAIRGATADLFPVSLEDRREWFRVHSPDSYPIWIAEENGRIQGWCSLSPYRPGRMALRHIAEISYYIHENHRREGIASVLIEHAITECPKLGIKHLFALLLDVNSASIKILEKFSFKKWGHMPDVAEFDNVICSHVIYGRAV